MSSDFLQSFFHWGKMKNRLHNIAQTYASFFQSKKRLNLFSLIALILCVTLLVVYAREWQAEQVIENIEFVGSNSLSEDYLRSVLPDSIIGTKQTPQLLKSISASLNKISAVKECDIASSGSSTIVIYINEAKPAAVRLNAKGSLEYIGDNGKVLKTPGEYYKDVPLISGFNFSPISDTSLKAQENYRVNQITKAIDVIERLKSYKDGYYYHILDEIRYNSQEKSYEVFLTNDRIKIIVEPVYGLDAQLEKLDFFWLNRLLSNSVEVKEYIDLRWNDRIIYS